MSSAHDMFDRELRRYRPPDEVVYRDFWCVECGIHRAKWKGGKCPSCTDDREEYT